MKTKPRDSFNDMIARVYPEDERQVRSVTLQVTDGCNLMCRYCVAGDTPIFIADGTEKPVRDVKEGETVLGFNEFETDASKLCTQPAKVTKTFRRNASVMRITLENGKHLRITHNHRVLLQLPDGTCVWKAACVVKAGQYMLTPGEAGFDPVRVSAVNLEDGLTEVFNLETETGTYIANGLAVHNCYQINKHNHFMTFELAKEFLDMLLEGRNPYMNFENTKGIMLEFIGGEPFIAIGLIRQVTEYVLDKMITEKHPWLEFFRISMSSNGTLYFQPEVQSYLRDFGQWVSLGISIDGNREVHDACRVDREGHGSYDIAAGAALHYLKHYGISGTKMTLAPGNIDHAADAVWNLLNLGFDEIFLNCVYEKGWEPKHATILYNQLKTLSNALFRTGRCDQDIYIRMFDEENFTPKNLADDDKNWCGGNGDMLAVDWKGDLYPCLRFMESSLGDEVPPVIIGTVKGGLEETEEQKKWVRDLQAMTWSSQSTEECINCPIATGCSWCFPAGTQVLTPEGYRAIEDIKPGDLVTDGDGNTQSVTANMERMVSREELVWVRADGFKDTLVTREHPFLAREEENGGGEWIPAGDLKPGYCIFLFGKGWAEVRSCELEIPEQETVYNLTVDNSHTFIANGAVVHNCTAYNFQEFHCLNKRATYICVMHKAEALANVYFWNMLHRRNGEKKRFPMRVPKEWALEIIPESEYEMLCNLAKEDWD